MKSWGDLPPPRPRRPIRIEPTGPGFARLGITVLVPELALQGSDLVAVAVLEDPDTGDWFGEDPTYPGSALVAIDKDRVVPRTPDAMAALEHVAAAARELLDERVAQAADAFARRCHALARQAAADLPRPTLSDLAVDLGRVVRGSIPPAATWRRTPDGVRLMTVRSVDDPLGWVEEWSSTEDLLVLDGPASREAAGALVATVASGPAERPAEIDDDVRKVAMDHLVRVAPDLAQIAVGPSDAQATLGSRANSMGDTDTHDEPHPWGPPSSPASNSVEWATEVLTAWAREAGFDLSGGLESIRLVPESVHGGSPGYGTRTGTWAEIGDFVVMWTRQGGSWVNVGWDYDEQGRLILTYGSQWRMGDPEEPREDGRAPDINLHGPPTTRPRASTRPAAPT